MSPTRLVYTLKAGEQLGDYKIVRPLGAGGMGEVYLVEHQHLRKRYALKILPADVAQDGNFIDRFRIEARVMADLEHPGIVRVSNFGEAAGRFYLVMDYVGGPDGSPRTLDDELAWGNKLPEPAALEMMIQLCDALDYAHTFPAGAIIHRDLKPGNILIQGATSRTSNSSGTKAGASSADRRAGGHEERVKIADFGLAKIVGTDYIRAVIDRSTHLTALPVRHLSPDAEATEINTEGGSTVSLLGTYDYMSPEQKTGGEVDGRSDLYALGLILYRMLTGHKPEGTYDPPSKSGVSKRWDPIVARCLKREVGQRYQSAAELKKDLLGLKIPVHRRVPALAVVAVAASLLTALAVLALRRPAAPPEPLSDSAPPEAAPPEAADIATILFVLEVTPLGAHVVVTRGTESVAEAALTGSGRTELSLKPGLYRIRAELAGYRPLERDVAVAADQPRRLSLSLEEAHGFLHLPAPERQRVSFVDGRGEQFTPPPPEIAGGKAVYRLPVGEYEILVSRPDYESAGRHIAIREGLVEEVQVPLAPLPGALKINSALAADVVENGMIIGTTGDWIRKLPAGPHKLELRRPAHRIARMDVTIPPNGEIALDAPALEEEIATLAVRVEIGNRTVAPEHYPKNGRVKIGEGEWRDVPLPWSGDQREVGRPMAIQLEIAGYEVEKQAPLTLHDRENKLIAFRILPLPVQLTVRANVPADIYRLRDGQFAQGWKRKVYGRDIPIGKTGQPLTIDPFVPQKLTLVAEGYTAKTIDVHMLRPGATNEHVSVELEPLPPPSETDAPVPSGE